jgi:hypothetical protein
MIFLLLASFDTGNLANGLKIKQVEIVNDDPYRARDKFYYYLTSCG